MPQPPRASGDSRGSGLASPLVCGVLAITAVALWMVWPAFSPGRIVNLDAPRHLLRTVVMAGQFLPSGHVDGWSPWWYLGAQLFLFQSYGYFFLIGASALLLKGLVPLGLVFKAWYVLPIVVLPAATTLLALRLGVSRRGALAAALSSVIFSSPLGYGMQGMFVMGLLLQGAGVIGFSLAWPEILGALLDRSRSPWRTMLVVAAVLLVHFITGAYTLAVAGLVAAGLAFRAREPWPLLRYAVIVAAVLLLAGHSLFPSLELRELAGSAVGWGSDRDRLDRFVTGTLFGAQPLALAALAAAAWTAWRGAPALRISAIVLFATGLLGGANQQIWEPDPIRQLLDIMVRPRALPYAALLQAVFAGVALDAMIAAGERVAGRFGRVAWARSALAPVAAVVVLGLAIPGLSDRRDDVATEGGIASRDREVYLKLVEWLRENVKPPALVAVPRTLFENDVLGARSVISLLNLDTGLYTLGGDQAELVRPTRRASRVDLDALHDSPGRDANVLRAAGVSHVILSDPVARRQLVGKTDFELVFEYQRPSLANAPVRMRNGKPRLPASVGVYRLAGGGQWLHGQGITVAGMDHAPERISWTVDVPPGRPRRAVTTAVNWHPNWQAIVDGERVETRSSPAHHVAFSVPAGAKNVTLAFERSAREKAWNALSAATLVVVFVAWRRDARRRRETDGASVSEPS